ncbi:MAG TPA: FHA domain-containing protein [Baekduia sp.]|uniref:FHA domain-containing protein n=1 Tax=Baekduia sp. TaxID=2600305 RepID=UPI002D78404C|nr:FHA domain-containing protein [Baekduia sp.]HET6505857.1 FHA domain-containing protein [Baekduia sp.]
MREISGGNLHAVFSDPLARHSATPSELQALMVAERDGTPFLALRDADHRLRLLTLDAARQRVVTIGRRPDSDVAVAWDGEVSGLHAELTGAGDTWTISDDGLSTNGTYLNGQRVSRRRRLSDGDRIRAGKTVIAFNAPAARPVPPTLVVGLDGDLDVSPAQKRVLVALCRPYLTGGSSYAAAASNQQIAAEIFLSLDAVKTHLRALFAKFELNDLPQNQKRAKLAETALQLGIVSVADLER